MAKILEVAEKNVENLTIAEIEVGTFVQNLTPEIIFFKRGASYHFTAKEFRNWRTF